MLTLVFLSCSFENPIRFLRYHDVSFTFESAPSLLERLTDLLGTIAAHPVPSLSSSQPSLSTSFSSSRFRSLDIIVL